MDVSIIVTTFNYAKYLNECLDSCLEQKLTDLEYEVIVIDDGSTDETPVLLAGRSDYRLNIFRIENSGIEIASNNGFSIARGRYIVRVDADDKLDPNYLYRMTPYMAQEYGFCYSDYTIIDSESNFLENIFLPEFDYFEIMSRGDFLATGTLIKSELLQLYGGYSTFSKNCGLENYELIIKFISNGVKGIHVAENLFKYRRHHDNISIQKLDKIISYGCNLFEQNRFGKYQTNENHPYKLVIKK